MPDDRKDKHRHLAWLGALAGAVLLLIGIRFLLVPESATRTFGLPPAKTGAALQQVIGLRDVWLALLAVAFAALREWRALALWLLLGAGVCLADAGIVWAAAGHPAAVAFHLGSGVFCLILGLACRRRAAG